jgi:hypothetical protein
MNRILSFCIIIVMILASFACSGKKPPEQAAVRSKNVLSVLREMNTSYEKKDLDAFMADVTGAYPDRDRFAKTLATVFAKYETIRFNVHYAKMIITIEQKGPVRATFTWDAEWKMSGGATMKDGGRVTLVFETGTFKLASVDGKNPFLAQPGEAPAGSKP